MSRYAWERGTITIPTKEWTGLKKAVREAHNTSMETQRTVALGCHEALKKAGIRTRRAYEEREYNKNPISHLLRNVHDDGDWRIVRSLFSGQTGRLVKPKKKDFPLANTATHHYEIGEASLTFDNDSRQVHWDVPENNHAPERAHEYPEAQALFRHLHAIGRRGNWTSRSGGEILGNDEYNVDSGRDVPGGGGSYVVFSFGKMSNDRPAPAPRRVW